MKLNIEELARESGYRFADDDGYDRMKNHGEYQRRWLKSFTRLIVERCAQEAEALADKLLCVHDNEGALIALEARGNIRQLLED